ncbi:SLBB domain-containing protein [Reichenbachiella carrageenanivorans]|uniref:SLBB domain-containing protein n=1 Tax=Reichenbachiella carrageenanivorans TaxID=2979869 RepID=A0ABY6D4R2_9BACT|nr:SLBB domain-containing protein [Reichenbachiella carrageenanivorans]UXX80610.1 SLBB domain-containing protein [Reichenbachiella carrageenanivorans]
MRRILLSILLLAISLGQFTTVQGQSAADLQNLQNIDIDNLTPDQMSQLIQKLESSGMSEEQLVQMAKMRGMSDTDITKLRGKILQAQASESTSPAMSGARTRTNPMEGDAQVEQLMSPMESINSAKNGIDDSLKIYDQGLEVFGLKFFRASKLTFEPNLNVPSPANYTLGPGDELYIDIWGASEQNYQVTVSPEGSIRVPSIGPIFVNGLKMEEAKTKIIARLKKIYSTIGRSSFADVTLGQIRTISIHVIGQVHKPGTYSLTSFGTVFNALYNAGGPTINGSLRQIEVYRERELISTLDAYEFFIKGLGENTTLKDQDVVIVKPYINRVRFQGEIKRPAAYELKEGETFGDLLNFAGGFAKNAYSGTLNVIRAESNFRVVKSIAPEERSTFVMKNGDEIVVPTISTEFKSRVTIEGPVLNPGQYELTEGLTLVDLLKKADGLRGDTFMERAVIIRRNDDFSLSNLAFDPKKIIAGSDNMLLQNNDVIRFESIYSMREAYNITIEGEVLKPGTLGYAKDMTVEDMIYRSGGFKESAARSFVEVARRTHPDSTSDANKSAEIFNFPISKDLSLSAEASNFKLQPFDLVVIRKSPFFQEQEIVEVEGETKFPGKYSLERKDERISSLLERSGGLTNYAYAKGATLIRRTEYYKTPHNGNVRDAEGNIIADVKVDDDASEIRRQDLTYRFRKEGFSLSDSLEIFRQQEAIGINLEKIIESPGSKYDLILRKGDILSIPRLFQTVRVRGEVLYPSNIQHNKGSGFKHYISSAGGFDQRAKKSKSYAIYANGSAAQTQSFLWFRDYPQVEPGMEIVVPKKPEKQPLSPQAWVAMASSIATIALIVSQIVSK